MRVTVIGASGGIGSEFVRQGIEDGHEITAVVRDSARSSAAIREWEKVPVGGPGRLQVAVVDSLSPGALVDAVAGRDGVVSALGPAGRGSDPTVNSRGVRAATMAMRETGTLRIVAVSAAPLFADGPFVYRRVARPLLWAAFGAHYRDLVRMEQVLVESGLDWSTVRPPKLTNRAGGGHPGLVADSPPVGGFVARADVAFAILRVLSDSSTIGHHVGVGPR
ncbi:MAG TPA: NAD(P)H-binding protein [Mycobacteriales bacterium]|nr:NAD(P)H-binding protein [Mycobacteriales bacterium]